jgi:predicted SnoaL-like aldol condensation-catalyzing enzyme
MTLQNEGFDFIKEMHNRDMIKKEFFNLIRHSLSLAKKRKKKFIIAENDYGQRDPTVLEGQDDLQSKFGSFFEHYIHRGMKVCIYYLYADEIGIGLTSDNTKDVTESCR